ncbi:carbohydrate ABC transporter permease [Deinococcus cellulosilyticus]|uniref:Sugar ABC transporter permease n=1 Tax=Deinococcus cellulosilyticus (strain DSM 18568 / NBRC 106333 / KACC 11606 / 5516J-15) TaxID=1223518 RepID=A0A511N8C9_DEIC1|nr:sugar ABC transporter permease [Deinococcus cellulosilyticus]GEM49099.1 sugar ABC transporter permease [Deinococcus cellulosilyticus NBRC 106333 = KACC 11606]
MSNPTFERRTLGRPAQHKNEQQDLKSAVWMTLPAFLGLLFFIVLPFLLAVVFSFSNQRLMSPNPTEFVGLRNYDRLLSVRMIPIPAEKDSAGQIMLDENGQPTYPRTRTILRAKPALEEFKELQTFNLFGGRYALIAKDALFWMGMLNILKFTLMVVPLQCGVALLLAVLINQKLPGMTFFRTVFFSPVVTSMVVISIVWTFLYDRQVGLINQILSTVTFGHFTPIDWLGDPQVALLSIVIMSAWQGMGFQMVIFLAGLQSISEELYEAAELDGASTLQKFLFITWPGLRNTTRFVLTTTTIGALGLFTQVDVMTQGGPNNSTLTVMMHAVRSGYQEQDIAYGSTISVVLFVMVLGIALVQRRLSMGGQKWA